MSIGVHLDLACLSLVLHSWRYFTVIIRGNDVFCPRHCPRETRASRHACQRRMITRRRGVKELVSLFYLDPRCFEAARKANNAISDLQISSEKENARAQSAFTHCVPETLWRHAFKQRQWQIKLAPRVILRLRFPSSSCLLGVCCSARNYFSLSRLSIFFSFFFFFF